VTFALEYLEKTAVTHENKMAFIGEKGSLTFGALHNKARNLGSFLHARGVYKQPVVVFMEKSADMVAAFCGVVYGGCFYVPLDPEMPVYRIQQILETVEPVMVVCDAAAQQLYETRDLPYPVVHFDEAAAFSANEKALQKIRANTIDTDPLYVVFTSGSTGVPKGVTASHRSVIDYIENLSAVLSVDETTVFGNQSPLYLDACLKELYPTFKFGATTYLIPPQLFMFPVKLIEYINENKINTICWVASALGLVAGLGALKKALPHTLHTIAFGSEVFAGKHLKQWREAVPNAQFIHLYGPTEATGMSLFYKLDRVFDENEAIPIGRPFPNTDVILLDDENKTPATGEKGEICIRGSCLCLGYYNDPARTAAAFVQNPGIKYFDLLYKTGDLGYQDENGLFYFAARKDHQIKHMGYRIELAEIEWVAARIPGVQLSCAVFDEEKKRIILYYMADVEKTAVLAALKQNLPRYMVPHSIIPVETMPQTPGGKINRVKLLTMYKAGGIK